jgi:hypothetical protein
MTKQEYQHNQDPEIDLIDLVKRGLSWLSHTITIFLNRLLLNKWLVASLIVLSIITGYSLRFFLPRQYQTEGIFLSNSLDAKMCSLLLNNLNQITGDTAYNKVFAEKLKTSPSIVRDIVSIEAAPILSGFYFEENDSASIFRVKLTVMQNADIPSIQKGIINFLENNEYALKRKEAHQKTLKALYTIYATKLKSLDSLKTASATLNFPRVDGLGFITKGSFDPVEVYQAEINYYIEQMKITEKLERPQNIEVIQAFVNSGISNYPDFNKLMLKFIIGGILLALVIAPIFGKNTP